MTPTFGWMKAFGARAAAMGSLLVGSPNSAVSVAPEVMLVEKRVPEGSVRVNGREGSRERLPHGQDRGIDVLRSHLLAGCNFGPYSANEIQYAWPLLDAIPSKSLTILDRGFFGARFLLAIEGTGNRQWLTRASSDLKYRERWELELGYDEIKTELLDREDTIRSRKPDGVKQEIWGILLAYNLVRLEMARIAVEADASLRASVSSNHFA